GRLRGGLRVGYSHGGVYAETFAVYMLLYLALGLAGRYLVGRFDIRVGTLALSGLAALCSLAALVWPVLRGIPWRQVRQDIGWQMGSRPWLEPLLGVGCYAMALPMVFVALLLMIGLTAVRDR